MISAVKLFEPFESLRSSLLPAAAAVICPLLIALVLGACGADDGASNAAGHGSASAEKSSPPSRSEKTRFRMSKAEISKLPQYKIRALPKPAPRKLVVKDLRKGFGATLRPGDSFLVDFAGSRYGRPYETTPATRNRPERFSFDYIMTGWKKGLPGMKVGGRRELIVPTRLGTATEPVIYLIDLLALYPVGGL